MDQDADLPDLLADLARDMRAQDGTSDALEMGVKAVLDHLDGADHCGVSLVQGKDVVTIAPSSEVVQRGDELQIWSGEGPCLDALTSDLYVHSLDLKREVRWPQWAPRVVAELGVRSMLCLQLFVHERRLGALNIYSMSANGFTVADIVDAGHFAAHIAVALAAEQEVEQLHVAISRRTTIGRAEGILMKGYSLDAGAAFAVLVRLSQAHNIKLYDIANEVCQIGDIPPAYLSQQQ